MDDAYTLLKINPSLLRGFHHQARLVENVQTERNIRQQTHLLELIEQRTMAEGLPAASVQSIQEIMDRVVAEAHQGTAAHGEWSARELRIVAYYLIKLQGDDDAFLYALQLLDDSWCPLFLNGLAFFLLNFWNSVKPALRRPTCRLFTKRLQAYTGSNRRVTAWKNHANYFDDAGPLRLLQVLLTQNQDILQAPVFLGYKANALAHSFYSDIIIGYTREREVGLNKLGEVFDIHNNARTKKLILAEYVEKSDKRGDTEKQTMLSNFINSRLGDVTLAVTWAPFPGATDEEAQRLKRAMLLARKWLARKIIETFFKVCVQDKQRELFWLRYVNDISGFRIAGSALTRLTLSSDPATRDMFMPFFIETNSRTSQTSALILSIKNKVMIEFSDVGALYVYSQDDVTVRFLRNDAKRIASIRDLKTPSADGIVQPDYWGYMRFYEEGKMNHIGNWTYRLGQWMQRKVLTDDNTHTSFYEERDSGTFTAKEYTDNEL